MTAIRWMVSREEAIILLIYLISYVFYRCVLHIPFDATPINGYMQYLDPALLKQDLLRSLWYLHSQPPLMNFIAGVALKIGGDYADVLLAGIYFVCGMIVLIFLSRAFVLLGVRRFLRMGMCIWLCAFPTFILYANWAYAAHLEFSMCCVTLYYLAKLFDGDKLTFGAGLALFLPCTILEFLRSQWHLVFFVGMAAIILWMRRKSPGKACFSSGSALALSPVVLLYLKNFLVFGFFGASSWMGMNLAEVASEIVPKTELEMLQQSGDVSPFFPVRFKPEMAEMVRDEWNRTGQDVVNLQHPALARKKSNGIENYNYLPYIEGSKQDLQDSLAVISYAPMAYIKEVYARVENGMHWPSIAYPHRDLIDGWGEWVHRGCVLLYMICPALALGLALWPKGYMAQHRNWILTAMFLTACITVSSSAFTFGGESERMRWGVAPFYLTFFVMLLESAARISLPIRYFLRRTTCLLRFLQRRSAVW